MDHQDQSEVWAAFRVARRARPFDVSTDHETFAEAADKWRRRVDRIVWNRLFFKLSADKDGFTEEHLRAFDAMDLPGKLAFVRRPYPDVRCAVVCGDDYDVDAVKFYRSSLRHFDLSGWLNGERLAG